MVYLSLLAYGRYRQNLIEKNKSKNDNPIVPYEDDDIQIIEKENSQNNKNKFKAFSSSFSNVNPRSENILPTEPSPSLHKKLVFNISPSNPVKDKPFKKQMIPSTVINKQTKKTSTTPRNQVPSATNAIRQNPEHQDLGSIPQPLVQVESNSPTKPTKRPSPTLVSSEEPLSKKRWSTLDQVLESVPAPVPIPTSGPTTVPGPQNLEPSRNFSPSKPRNVEGTEPQMLEASGPRNVEVIEPPNLKQTGPRNLETTGSRNVEVTEPQNLKPTRHRNLETTEPRNPETTEPRNPETTEPRNLETTEPRNPETTEPRNPEPTGPQNVEETKPKNDSGSVQQMQLLESDITGNQNLTGVHRKKFTGNIFLFFYNGFTSLCFYSKFILINFLNV